MRFGDVRQGTVLYILDETDKPKFYTSIVKDFSKPYVLPATPQQYGMLQPRVLDISAFSDVEEKYQQLPENSEIARQGRITIFTSRDALAKQVEDTMRNSMEIINSVDRHKEIYDSCEEILKNLNPSFAHAKEQEEEITRLKEHISNMDKKLAESQKMVTEGQSRLEEMMRQFLESQKTNQVSTSKTNK